MICMAASVFASDWYVCMGSFANLDKAKQRVENLSDAGFSVFINKIERTDDSSLYRILYSEKIQNKDEAIFRRNELLELSKIKDLSLMDIWCCQSNGEKYPVEAASVQTKPELPEAESTQSYSSDPQKQTVIVKINNIEEQRFDITSDDRVIRVNINVDEMYGTVNPEVQTESDAAEK